MRNIPKRIRTIRRTLRKFNNNLGNLFLLFAVDIIMLTLAWAASTIICTDFGTVMTLFRLVGGFALFIILSTIVWIYMGENFYDRYAERTVGWKCLFYLSLLITSVITTKTGYITALSLIDQVDITKSLMVYITNPTLKTNYVGLILLFFPIWELGLPIGVILGNRTKLFDDLDEEEYTAVILHRS